MDLLFRTLLALAFGLFAALWIGRLAQRLRIPRVTAYLLVGMVLGPHVLGQLVPEGHWLGRLLVGEEAGQTLAVIKQVALGFILFGVGSEFRLRELRRTGPRILALSLCEVLATAGFVFAAVLAISGDLALASIAMVMATASAPSATLLTLREVEAEGPTSRSLIQLVGLNNLITLLAFPLLLALCYDAGDPVVGTRRAFAGIFAGLAIGLVAAVSLETLGLAKDRAVLGVLVVFASLGAARWLSPDPTAVAMLSCFGAGLALTNASPHASGLAKTLGPGIYPLYVLFFIGAGAELHIESLAHLGILGVAFIAARTLGKLVGCRVGLAVSGLKASLPPGLGSGLLCQAGVALGLVATLELVAGAATADLRNVVLASVVFFELLGPIMTRRCAVAAGEVKLANLLPIDGENPRGAIREVVDELGKNLGVHHWGEDAESNLVVRHVMLRAPYTARANTGFEAVLKMVAEVDSDLLPVTDEEGRLLGVISSNDMKNILYDTHLRGLVIAEDLMQPLLNPLEPDMALQDGLERMDREHRHSYPVVERGKLVGMVKRKDVYSTLHKAFARSKAPEA